jgi:hypothetical protein
MPNHPTNSSLEEFIRRFIITNQIRLFIPVGEKANPKNKFNLSREDVVG